MIASRLIVALIGATLVAFLVVLVLLAGILLTVRPSFGELVSVATPTPALTPAATPTPTPTSVAPGKVPLCPPCPTDDVVCWVESWRPTCLCVEGCPPTIAYRIENHGCWPVCVGWIIYEAAGQSSKEYIYRMIAPGERWTEAFPLYYPFPGGMHSISLTISDCDGGLLCMSSLSEYFPPVGPCTTSDE